MGSSATLSCFQQVNTGASAGSEPPIEPIPFGHVPDPGDDQIPTIIDTPKIQIVDDIGRGAKGDLTTDPCEQTNKQVTFIFTSFCAGCHQQGAASQGLPQFDCVLEYDKLVDPSKRTDMPGVPFVMPGHPEQSRLYQRMADGSMPKVTPDATMKQAPRPTVSDISVVDHWIRSCAPGAPRPGSSTGTGATTGGPTGAGGSSSATTSGPTGAGGGSAGTGGSGGGSGGSAGKSSERDAGTDAAVANDSGNGGSGNGGQDGGLPACAPAYNRMACGGYAPGEQVSRMGQNYTCANVGCRDCATMFQCQPGSNQCPAGNVWTNGGPCR
jgi:hypothetical protein